MTHDTKLKLQDAMSETCEIVDDMSSENIIVDETQVIHFYMAEPFNICALICVFFPIFR